jgi:phenylpyruvate tautomerase PptA (4-oxalocrotonate tautomerase family)
MPLVRIQTNVHVESGQELLSKLSSRAAGEIGKPEAYVMTALDSDVPMTFGGSSQPLAFIECKSIGLSESQTEGLSAALCSFCEEELGVAKDRVYIEFSSAKGSMWGWRGGTF